MGQRSVSNTVTGTQLITEFSELLEVLNGLRGKVTEASVFLPADEDGYPVSTLFGRVRELTERPPGRWELSWQIEAGTNPVSSVTLWSERFVLAELQLYRRGERSRRRDRRGAGAQCLYQDSLGWLRRRFGRIRLIATVTIRMTLPAPGGERIVASKFPDRVASLRMRKWGRGPPLRRPARVSDPSSSPSTREGGVLCTIHHGSG